jgi:tetratricopeptide (TPR) repeat protein
MRWVIAIVWISSFVAHAAPVSTSFIELSRQAEAARRSDHLPQAIKFYQEALQLRPAWSAGWWELGSIYYDLDLFAESRRAFEHALREDKKLIPAYAFLGLCEYELRDYTEARRDLREWRAAGSPGGASLVEVASLRWAELLTQDGRFLEALYLLNSLVPTHGPNPALVEAMGLAWMQMKNVPEDYPPEKREQVWLAGSAAAWMSASRMDRSREFLDRLARRYGDQPNVHFLRGFVDESLKDTDSAIAEYRQELKIAPNSVAPMIQLALLYADAGRNEEALSAAQQAVRLSPGNARCHYALGRVLQADERWADSVSELEEARRLSPNASKVRFQLAKSYRKLGRKEDAAREEAAFEELSKKAEGRSSADDPMSLNQGTAGRGQ